MINSIGSFQFISLLGPVAVPTGQIVLLPVRMGVDGRGLKRTGVRGVPFRLRSAVDQPSLAAAHVTLAAYLAMIGAAPVELVQDYFTYSTFKVAVLDVQQPRITPNAGSSGGLYPPSWAKLVCLWDLVAIANV